MNRIRELEKRVAALESEPAPPKILRQGNFRWRLYSIAVESRKINGIDYEKRTPISEWDDK